MMYFLKNFQPTQCSAVSARQFNTWRVSLATKQKIVELVLLFTPFSCLVRAQTMRRSITRFDSTFSILICSSSPFLSPCFFPPFFLIYRLHVCFQIRIYSQFRRFPRIQRTFAKTKRKLGSSGSVRSAIDLVIVLHDSILEKLMQEMILKSCYFLALLLFQRNREIWSERNTWINFVD